MRLQHETRFLSGGGRLAEMGYMRHNFSDLYDGLGQLTPAPEAPSLPTSSPPIVTTQELVALVAGIGVAAIGYVTESEAPVFGKILITIGGAAIGSSVFANINRRK